MEFETIGQPSEIAKETMEALKEEEAISAQATAIEEGLLDASEELSNPLVTAFRRAGKTVEEYKANLKESEKARLEQKIAPAHEIEEEAEKASQEHPDLNKNILKELAHKIKDAKNKEEILNILKETYQDPTLVNHALVFLSKITRGDLKKIVDEALETHEQVFEIGVAQAVEEFVKKEALQIILNKAKAAKDKEELLNIVHGFYPEPTIGEYVLKALAKATTGKPKEIVDEALKTHSERFSREIKAQASILESLEQAKAGKAETPKVLEKVYRDFIEKPLAANQMLSELLEKYGPKDSRKITAYLLHSLGSDLKAHGAAIEPGRLSSLVTEIRGLQSVIGVLQFFKARVKLIDFLLKRENLPLPPNLKFEELAKTFVALAQERYPSPEKVTQSIAKFGAAMEILSKIIIISQMRDGTREVSLKLFRRDENRDDSIENRDKLFHAIIEALDGLEDELDALAEKQEQERLQSEAGDEPIQKKDEPIQKK